MNKNNRIQIPLRQKIILIIFGLFLTLAILETGLRLRGFILLSLQERRNLFSIRQRGGYRIMCLGESTTGLGGNNAYPYQLEEILNQRHTGIKFSVINKGVPSVFTSYILAHLEENINKYRPDIVITMIGINDYGPHMLYYNDNVSKTIPFLRALRIYKFIRLLYLHIITKITEARFRKDQGFLEEAMKRIIKINPKNYNVYMRLASFYQGQGKYDLANKLLKKTLEANSKNMALSNELAWLYMQIGHLYKELDWFNTEPGKGSVPGREYTQLEQSVKKSLEANIVNARINGELSWLYAELGRLYARQEKNALAEAMLKKVIEMDPERNDKTYVELGRLYARQEKNALAETMLKKAIEANRDNYWAYFWLYHLYSRQEKNALAEAMLKKAIEANRDTDHAHLSLKSFFYRQLGWFYAEQKKYIKAEELFKKATAINVYINDGPSGALAIMYKECGKDKIAEEYYNKISSLEVYSPSVMNNYRKIKETLDKKGIQLVCMQYPLLNIEPLKEIFVGQSGIIFVDNEKVFKDALSKSSYKEYFTDIFAGNFGHCTLKGNRLLAENIANAILKEVFNK